MSGALPHEQDSTEVRSGHSSAHEVPSPAVAVPPAPLRPLPPTHPLHSWPALLADLERPVCEPRGSTVVLGDTVESPGVRPAKEARRTVAVVFMTTFIFSTGCPEALLGPG